MYEIKKYKGIRVDFVNGTNRQFDYAVLKAKDNLITIEYDVPGGHTDVHIFTSNILSIDCIHMPNLVK